MIRINRGDAPEGFMDRAERWQARFAQYRQEQPDITASVVWSKLRGTIEADANILAQRFRYKCAYCESKPNHVSHPHVEHFRPKGLIQFEGKMFTWSNWLLSCGICNEEKWRHFPEEGGQPLLLNPAEEEPSRHICFAGPHLRGMTKRGKKTVKLVELDRQSLRDARESWLNLVNTLLLLCVESDRDEVRHACREHLIWMMQDEASFAGMTRAYLSEKCPRLAQPVTPHPHLEERNRLDQMREMVEQRSAELERLT
jgi:hypothetical protein